MIAVYLRVSTTKQDHKAQLRGIFDWLKGQGLGRRDVAWFRDRGEPSAATSRPAFDRLMQAIDAGTVERLVVWKLDRIGRWDSDDFLIWRLRVKARGCEIVSVTEGASNFSSLTDKIVALVEADGRAKWLRDHRDRVRAGIRAKRKAGAAWGGGLVRVNKRGTAEGCSKLSPAEWAEIKRRIEVEGQRPCVASKGYPITLDAVHKRLARERRSTGQCGSRKKVLSATP